MTPEQKQHAIALVKAWGKTAYGMHADAMAALLQELIEAPAPEPVARMTGYYGGYMSIATVDGRVLPAGTALYTAPPAPIVPDVANTFKRRAEEIVAMAVNRENYAKINRTIADLVTDIANAAEAPTPAEVLTTTNQAQISSLAAPEPEPVAWAYEIPVAGGYQTRFSETEPTLLLELNKRPLYDAPPAPSVLDVELQAAFDRGLKAGNEQEANARRIVACVNACEGIPTGVLEKQGMVPIEQVTHDIEQQRDKLLAALEGLTDDICSLIDESSGVANLHLNGDIAFWSELEAGGQFERLTHLPDALRIIAEVKGQP